MRLQLYIKLRSIHYSANHSPHNVDKAICAGRTHRGEFGGNQVSSNFYATAQYEQKFAGIIINGILYRTLEPGATNNYMGWEATDLRTGKTIWYQNQSATAWLRMGQIFSYVSINQYGGLAYLWGESTNSSTKHRKYLWHV